MGAPAPGDAPTFEAYCRERWGFVASRARQLIAASAPLARHGAVERPALHERVESILRARRWTTSPELRAQLDEHRGPLAKADLTVAAILSAGFRGVRTHLQPAILVEYPDEKGTIRRGEPATSSSRPSARRSPSSPFTWRW